VGYAVALAGGADHTLVVGWDGTVLASGQNLFGQLGDGTVTQRLTPVPVSGLTDVMAVAAGNGFSLIRAFHEMM
jgi:alpha-tubulin suppressor-like RCC1 family protein